MSDNVWIRDQYPDPQIDYTRYRATADGRCPICGSPWEEGRDCINTGCVNNIPF